MENNQKELIILSKERVYLTNKSTQKTTVALIKCYCGKEFKTHLQHIKSGHTKSCGCLSRHNLSYHRLYNVWSCMITRTTNKNIKRYKDWGGRGIKVCDRWLNVANFIEDMYPTFQEGLTLDRKDNSLGYFKDNCRWVEKNIQARNSRKLKSTNTTGYRGVSKAKNNKFTARLCVNYIAIHIGTYETKLEAAKAYDNYVIANNLEHTRNFS